MRNGIAADPGMDLREEAHRLLRQVLAATRAHQADVEKIAGLSAAQVRLLVAVKQHPGCTVGECAALLGLSLPTVSNLLRDLTGRKFVRTLIDGEDRRRLRLHLTPVGAARVRRDIPFAAGMLNAVIGSLDEPSLRALATGLRALCSGIPTAYSRREGAARGR